MEITQTPPPLPVESEPAANTCLGKDCNGGAAISVRNLAKRYGRTEVLRDVTFQVPVGSVCGLVGPNGAGKTTAIQIMMDLLKPTDGKVRVLGLDPGSSPLKLRQRVGYVPQKQNIYSWMTVKQALSFVSQIFPAWDEEELKSANAVLQVPLDRKVKALSGGELAKLALLMALAHRPELLLLDEPTAELDPLVRRDFLDAVVDLVRTGERTILFSTHILSDLERIADRVILLANGRVVVDDTLDGLRLRFVKASFLFTDPPSTALVISGARHVQRGQREWVAVFDSLSKEKIQTLAREIGAASSSVQTMSLDDIFIELVRIKE